ncbi:MAG: hypothetical protein M0R80_08195 [Proteobacteria bacterium]|nr:hypothetical protein [Pseudomonadota bacterium]
MIVIMTIVMTVVMMKRMVGITIHRLGIISGMVSQHSHSPTINSSPIVSPDNTTISLIRLSPIVSPDNTTIRLNPIVNLDNITTIHLANRF